MIKGSSSFIFLSDVKTESMSENIIKLLWSLSKMLSSAKSIARASVEKMVLSFRGAFL